MCTLTIYAVSHDVCHSARFSMFTAYIFKCFKTKQKLLPAIDHEADVMDAHNMHIATYTHMVLQLITPVVL